MTDELTGDPPKTPSPGEFIREEMKARKWTQADLAAILNRPLPTVNEIIQGKRAIMPEMAMALAEAFATTAEIWMHREADYRLSLAGGDFSNVKKRARFHELAPIKEMQRRGWIKNSEDELSLESELRQFFDIASIDHEPQISASMRMSSLETDLTPSQRAWCFRVKRLARAIEVAPFREDRLPECEKELRRLAAYPQEAKKITGVLASYGIRFVIVEPLQGCKIDGAALWINEQSPVIGLSLRFDRIDGFWFTLGHEFSHIKHRDSLSVDADLTSGDQIPSAAKTPSERRADDEAASLLIPEDTLRSFIARVGPQYSRDRVVQFAHKIKIHPGIIVGQLQHRGEIGYHALRDLLVKVRDAVIPTSVTDGWGYTMDVGNSR